MCATAEFFAVQRVRYRYTGEVGTVSSVNPTFVFVKFVRHGVLQVTAEGCFPDALESLECA